MEYSVENIPAGARSRFALTNVKYLGRLESFHSKNKKGKLCRPPFLVWVLLRYHSVLEKVSVRDTSVSSFF